MVTKNREAKINQEQKGDLIPLLYTQRFSQNNLAYKPPDNSKLPTSFLFIGRWFRFGLMLFLLLSVLLGTVGCSTNAATIPWSVATKVVPVETVQAVVTENSELNPQEAASNILAWTVDGQAGKLVIFNFNNPGVCGKKGCLYVAYLIRKDATAVRVFSSYLNPNLPPNKSLLQVADDPTKSSGLPCLQVQQPSGDNIKQLVFCFNGREYQLAKSSLIEVRGK
ncbi:hypothetical protein NIES2119_17900 [[Phormidium ambiguum] IAM M-71]|uniref:Uncharacterized protein n=1 Tax=[Phormidium ambiguum] IAM M-71 TaxID=454136 RepID=A0A1U7IGM3_9CYAN|nr:hypothetical protein [Phormidium ambiguum]OKH36188.1 hypothetical protein NIES2119_17900 [Phormidium ambiguum IAM M-71]